MSSDLTRLESVLSSLEVSSNRLDGLDSLRDIVNSSHSLPEGAYMACFFCCLNVVILSCRSAGPLQERLFSVACSCASDPNSRISHKWLQVNHMRGDDLVLYF